MVNRSFLDIVLTHRLPAPKLGVSANLTGKTVIIVGANTGIGLEAAKHFATMRVSRVILACRNDDKGRKAVEEVQKATATKSAELWLVDLSKFSSVVDFAERFENEGGRLDILVMNAAVAGWGTWEDMEGWESTLHVNHLSIALCSLLLLPRLLKTSSEYATQTRLVAVSSDVHQWVTMNEYLRNSSNILKTLNNRELTSLTCPAGAEPTQDERYSISKLLNVLFVRALSARLGPSAPVIVTAVNPGYCDSELRRKAVDYTEPVIEYNGEQIPLNARTSEEGARQLVWAALGPPNPEDTESIRGAYISENQIVKPGDFVLSKEGNESENRIWNETVDILNEATPKVRVIINQYLQT